MAHENAGQLSKTKIDLKTLERAFYNPGRVAPVKFGTSGHRGALGEGFCALHAKAIAQAVADYHKEFGLSKPILVGGDTRLMSRVTSDICASVLAANGLTVILPPFPVPTPVFSYAIINEIACASLNGTASHNPPQDMGLKYNPASGGPADSETTAEIEKLANFYLTHPEKIKEITLKDANAKGLIKNEDIVTPYIKGLAGVVDFDIIRKAALPAAIHPMGGASLKFYEAIIKFYKLDNITIVDKTIDPSFSFIPLDHDGKIRMDPSSQYPMKPLLDVIKGGKFVFAGASDPDADRFGCCTAHGGLINPNHALCVMADYLTERKKPAEGQTIGRTLGTTHLLDRIAASAGIEVDEQNIGFKYFVNGLLQDKYVLCGEESAGMSVGRWTTEKDGIFAVLLLLEIMSKNGDIADIYFQITQEHGNPAYTRIDIPTDEETKKKVKSLKKNDFEGLKEVAGEKVTKIRDTDGLKVYLEESWFLVRPSGTENIIKFYCESFSGAEQLKKVIEEGSKVMGIKL